MRWPAAVVAAFAAVLAAGELRAQDFRVVAEGSDLVFTWNTGRAENLLRGPSPDAVVPWQANVTSPFRAVGENVLRGEDAFYVLDGWIVLGFRLEKTFEVADPARPASIATTLPVQRAYDTPIELFAQWPTLLEVAWLGSAPFGHDQRVGAARTRAGLVGRLLDPLPPRGGVWLAFSRTTTVTIVGAESRGPDPDPRLPVSEYAVRVGLDSFHGVFPVPPHIPGGDAISVLCGAEGIHWWDADADGWPDECGLDQDGDGFTESGLHRRSCPVTLETDEIDGSAPMRLTVSWDATSMSDVYSGVNYSIDPGDGLIVTSRCGNDPWYLPRW